MSGSRRGSEYYEDKVDSLRALFGTQDVTPVSGGMKVAGRLLPVIDDVIVALAPDRLPGQPRKRTTNAIGPEPPSVDYAPDVQRGFGEEWTAHRRILPDHEAEFNQYFDLIDLGSLGDLRLCDLGCGIGRWSHFLAPHCREVVLVDFSEAIFVARDNLRHADNVIFVMADVLDLPFGDDAFDMVFCLGVLHHLPVDALDALRAMRNLAPRHLVYLYYALDNRPAYFRWIHWAVTLARHRLSRVRSARVRSVLTSLLALGVYAPLSGVGRVLRPLGLHRFVPLAEFYAGKTLPRVRQDVHDRFFTGIEQRFSRKQILALTDTFASVRISQSLPYWHFLCER